MFTLDTFVHCRNGLPLLRGEYCSKFRSSV